MSAEGKFTWDNVDRELDDLLIAFSESAVKSAIETQNEDYGPLGAGCSDFEATNIKNTVRIMLRCVIDKIEDDGMREYMKNKFLNRTETYQPPNQ